ncbi:glycoside hydrolase family 88 protein [Arcticibacter tournemirensis]|uniref:Glucuronyl hydrolase n=1 Tax=Arcticibacter tournemirensis TaxID=699437 RepID=A0A4Q0MDC8_9SPHI|nr:glycoside hydrolase family 88 protein [Arcticibacter tournemirensis]RXF71235.1 glucuronyl hydrolase [Arcticibacter tournemirensis]
MKYCLIILHIVLLTGVSQAQNINVEKVFRRAGAQVSVMLDEVTNADTAGKVKLVSPRTYENGQLKMVQSRDWTSGFFPGILWYLYEYTKDDKWLSEAGKFTTKIEPEKTNTRTHDLGFMIGCSFGNGYRLTGRKDYEKVLIEAAQSLSKRFNPVTGVIKSWDHNSDKWQYPVIIDNMMNLELLFEATRLTGDSSFYKIAVSHANVTMKNHFRADYSSYHVVDYDPAIGSVKKKMTHQGYSDESAWARGQGWALYGYTMCYRETKNKAYLRQAENIAAFILKNKNLPRDMVPYWDFNDPAIPNVPRDVSAAAVISSALYELSAYSVNGADYKKMADQMLKSLSERYISKPGSNKGFILDHSTGHKPAGSEIDVPLIYADYYYLEALLRYKTYRQPK